MTIRNIIDELSNDSSIDKCLFLESKANHLIVSAINVFRYIDENFSVEEANDLKKRIVNSIKTKNPTKFRRKITRLKEDNGR